jgi:hypothetical protein
MKGKKDKEIRPPRPKRDKQVHIELGDTFHD